MAHFETTFGDIRSLAQRPADAQTWRALMAAVMDARVMDDAIAEYARGVARRWPDARRVAPARALRSMEQGRAPRCLHLVRAVTLGPATASWIGRPELSGVTHLTYDAAWGDAEEPVRRALRGSFMRGLRALTVERARDGSRVAQVLCEEEAPAHLVALAMRPARLGFMGARALVAGEVFGRLESLVLEDPRCGVAGARLILGAASSIETFASIGAPGFELGDAGARAVAEIHPERLTELTLSRHAIGDAGARALAASRLMTALRRLDVRENAIGAGGVAALTGAIGGAQILDLRGNTARRHAWAPDR